MKLIHILEDKCKQSYSCVRICPVKAIEVKSTQATPVIVEDRCIGCGSCVRVCSSDAVTYYDSKDSVKELIQSGAKVAAVCGPSISGEFSDITDYRKFVTMIKTLGFTYVLEAAFAVDLVAKKYAELYNNFRGKYYISTCCPSVVSLIEKFHPELTDNLAPIISPMVASAEVVHEKYGEDVKVVYIGPCIDYKKEAVHTTEKGKVDQVLTFSELRDLFKEFSITESNQEFSEFDAPIGYKGSLYPLSNGILQAANISEDLLTSTVITAEGRDSVLEAVREFEQHLEKINQHFNLFFCQGCLMGPGTSQNGDKFLRRTLVIKYAKKRVKTLDKAQWEKDMETFQPIDFSRTFHPNDKRLPMPGDEQIAEVYKILGKKSSADAVNCGACGYASCQDFATAVAQGLARTDMCVNFTLRNRQEYIKALKITNEKLAKTQEALQISEKSARREQMLAKEASETVSAMLQKIPSGVVIADEKLKIIESNHAFIELLGEDAREINEIIPGLVGADLKTMLPYQFYNLFSYVLQSGEDVVNRDVQFEDTVLNVSIFPIRRGKIVGGVIRDISAPEVQKEEVVSRLGEVINENMQMVQQIAFLLGEGASNTERMLNSVIESHKTKKKDD
jgi:Na+-translocating ferredoxin:NAD+ oxidoreductase RNF subunit RnfB